MPASGHCFDYLVIGLRRCFDTVVDELRHRFASQNLNKKFEKSVKIEAWGGRKAFLGVVARSWQVFLETLGRSWAQHGPSWSQVGRKLRPRWAMLAPRWP